MTTVLHGFYVSFRTVDIPAHLKLSDRVFAASIAYSHVVGSTLGKAEEGNAWWVCLRNILCLLFYYLSEIVLHSVYAHVQILGAFLCTASKCCYPCAWHSY